ncbi:DUF3331 domain-containing protein [Paraburkholderia ultramafica]|uniref:DUF3331 domain-containing protein n=1 Tax=Paraburkholderia ultramafica TaxID=1544867 RepID=UPI003CCDE740
MHRDQIVDPWAQVVDFLAAITQGDGEAQLIGGGTRHITKPPSAAPDARHAVSLSVRTVTVKLVERISERALTVNWRDATWCCYVEQRWSLGVACRRGRCALSGTVIRNGDRIFSPRTGRCKPTNADAMMLASAIDAVMPVHASEHSRGRPASQD